MADSTQPEKIPSSQGSDGFADASAGHNAPSPGKDVKPTPPAASIDSFLSSPQPVSLIQSPQEGIKGLVSNKPSESVATSLRFLSQPGSFAPVVFDSHSQALGNRNLPEPPVELKEATKIEEVRGVGTDSVIEAVSSESPRHVAPISGTGVTFHAFSNLGLSSSPDEVHGKTPDESPATKVQELSQGVFSRGQTPEEPKVQGKPKADSETWGDGGFMLFKESHYERSPIKESTELFSPFNKDPSPDQDSPDSPFEVLDDSQRKRSFGKEFLETVTSDWVPTQIAAAKVVPDVDQAKDEKDQGPFGPLADIHSIEVTTNLEKTIWGKEPTYKSMEKEAEEDSDESRDSTPEPDEEEKKISPVSGRKTAPPPTPPPLPPRAKPIDAQVEEKQASPVKESSDEDLDFLPTAYIWEKPEKDAKKTQKTLEKSCADFENLPPAYSEVETTTIAAAITSSSPPSYASFKFNTEELLKSQQPATAKVPGPNWGVDSEPVENVDADSSGESDDTVIEDMSVVTEREPAVPKSTATVKDPEEMEQKVASAKLEKPLLVPIINVIETEEQIISDDESDEKASEVVVEPADRAGKGSSTPVAGTTPQDSKPADAVVGKEDSQPTSAESKTEKPKQDSEPVLADSEIKSPTQDSECIFTDSIMEKPTQDPKPVQADPKIETPSSVLADFAEDKSAQDQKPILFDSETKKSTQESQTSLDSVMEKPTQDPQPVLFDSETKISSQDTKTIFTDSVMEKPTQDPQPALFDSETKISSQDTKTIFTDSIMEKPTQDPKPVLFDSKIETPLSTGVESSVESFLTGGAVKADAYEKAVQDLGEMEMEKEDPTKRIQLVHLAETVEVQPTSIDASQASFSYAQDVPTNTTSTATTVQTRAEEPVVASEEVAKRLPKISFPSGKPEDLLPRAGPADQPPARSILPAIPKEMASRGGAESPLPVFKEELSRAEDSPDSTSDPESIEPECSVSAATDSFVDFMRECLKSRQDESPEDLSHDFTAKVSTTAAVAGSGRPQAAPTVVLDFEQEELTIKALKELGESLEEEEEDRNSPASKPGVQKLLLSSQAAPESVSKQQTATSPVQSHPGVAEISPSGAPREVEEAPADDNQRAAAAAEHALAALLTQMSVRELIYWRDLKTSAAVFGVTLLLLLSLAAFSVVSVLSYLLLALLTVTISFRVFKSVVQAVQKSDEGHPFRAYIEKDISLSSESFSRYVDTGLRHCNCVLKQLSRLFLVEDLVDSLKLAVFMWLMTYVGAVFNGITLLIIAHILVFSIPVVYEKYKTQIDHYVGIVHNQVKSVVSKVQAKVPGLSKRKPE